MYIVRLTIDQRPPRIDTVSERVYQTMMRLGWFADGRAVLIGEREDD